ncbi:MAG TPA: hypothetical protein VK492_05850 [Chitinophagaceae bacterium]|jgi:hypothetical protein|nr:hypothetical protein [Chitinophagaceae bacterium]
MKQKILITVLLLSSLTLFTLSCQKESAQKLQPQEEIATSIATANNPTFNLEVILRGEDGRLGHVKFRQDVDPSKIIVLGTWVRDLEPNHQYLLQRAVDAANVVDGNCTSTSWLTLGKGLTPQSILTDDSGRGGEELWRDVSAVASGSAFDIHFRIVDATTMAVVLTSDCYQYVVR